MSYQRLSTSNPQQRAEDAADTPDSAMAQDIYKEITEIEQRCVDSEKRNDPDKWKDVVDLHKERLQAYYRYFLHAKRSGDTESPDMRSTIGHMWRGILSFFQFLRVSLPQSRDHLVEFLSMAIDVVQLLLKDLPSLETTWMGIDTSERAVWSAFARSWYSKLSDKNPEIGRFYHHYAIAASTPLHKLFYISKALTCTERFPEANDFAQSCFKPHLPDKNFDNSEPLALRKFVRVHALFLARTEISGTLSLEFLSNIDSHIQCAGDTFREQGVQIMLANIAAIFDFGNTSALIPHMSAIQQTKSEMRDASYHYWGIRRYHGLIRWSMQRASFASKLTFYTFNALLRFAEDQNVLPSIHISLAFLWCATLFPRCMEFIAGDIPWSRVVDFLNSLVKPDIDMAKLASEEFPTHQNGPRKQLPEDYLLRGFAWAQFYFPDNFWNGIVDYDNRDEEFSSATMSRKLCCLWLGLNIARFECWIGYNVQDRSFSTRPIPPGDSRYSTTPQNISVADPFSKSDRNLHESQ